MIPRFVRGALALTAGLAALALAPMTALAQGAGDAGRSVGVAVGHVRANSADFGATRADVADLAVTSAYRSAHNGVTHVNLNQRYKALEVFGAHVTVNVAGGKVVFAGGDLERGLRVASDAARLGARGAAQAVAEALDLPEPENLRVLRAAAAGARETLLSRGGISEAPIPARMGWEPTERGLRLAWQLVIDDVSGEHLWNATIDADTGKLLKKEDWTSHDPIDELAERLTRSTSVLDAVAGPLSPNPVLDGSSYRVLTLPTESPNDRDRELAENPADGLASPLGWHDTDGAPGAEFTITRGNNVHAYLDQDDDEQQDFGGSPDGGPGLDFDFPVDLTEHAQFYRDAVVANLFYTCNSFHDILYRYGFDEASGNFQANNYGRGGQEGDYVRCEAADGSGTNNANFSTPTEPTSSGGVGTPRMQMYLWPGNQFGRQNQVVVDGAGEYGAGWARFGPPATNAGVGGTLVLVNDGVATGPVGTVNDGCEPYGPLPGGSIAVVDRANEPPEPPEDPPPVCSFLEQVENAEAAGAVAVVIVNNTSSSTPPTLSAAMVAAPPGIPAVSVNAADGAAIKAALPAPGTVRKNPEHPGIRDGDLENGIIFHEYGHGLSNRLTGGPAVNCLQRDEQAGEGWSDYVAIATMLDPTLDDPEGRRGMGPYALFQPSRQGNGIRPRPYSRNMAIQPFTYDSIKTGGWLPNAAGNPTSLAIPHGLGHGWAATLWDITWDLIEKHGFNPNVYEAWDTGGNNRAMQYMVDGLKLQGCAPTLLRSARAVIEAANLLGGGSAGDLAGDACTVYAGFARRGFGYSAVDGTVNRDDNEEAFDTHPACRRGFLAPVTRPYGELHDVVAGDTVPLRFRDAGLAGLDILARNNPYSRLVDCETLRTVDESYPFITPRPIPVPTATPGNSGLTRSGTGVYQYNWETQADWAGTCREVVVTRKDGRQHRAFFRFETE